MDLVKDTIDAASSVEGSSSGSFATKFIYFGTPDQYCTRRLMCMSCHLRAGSPAVLIIGANETAPSSLPCTTCQRNHLRTEYGSPASPESTYMIVYGIVCPAWACVRGPVPDTAPVSVAFG
ncbi:hypothetical protein PsYK624_135220 [Phanerochaete sordida]|uniref:Uncharacterized protein n=1 Tax=Phanerochaete sordida TaxID=48140 RepID=A0A9P3GM63_9APHY|nr:hypothetical protein PsYK624_135220 [Phanerochaete sordida]